MTWSHLNVLFFALLVCCLAVPVAGDAASVPSFGDDVAPLLTKYCTGCHNDADREGKLSLESYDSLFKGGAKGSVVTPGQPEVSRLIRVLTGEAKPKMPPDGEEAPKPAEIELLRSWISAGAKGPSGATAVATLITPKIPVRSAAKLPINAVALSPDG